MWMFRLARKVDRKDCKEPCSSVRLQLEGLSIKWPRHGVVIATDNKRMNLTMSKTNDYLVKENHNGKWHERHLHVAFCIHKTLEKLFSEKGIWIGSTTKVLADKE